MHILFTLFISTVLTLMNPVKKDKITITVTVVNATSDVGKVTFALYNKENFLKIPLEGKSAKITNGKSTISFENVPAGEYAVSCYHDKNDNGKMDFSPRGMPTEDYGTSNNKMTLGPPEYFDAKFMVTDKDVSLEIKF